MSEQVEQRSEPQANKAPLDPETVVRRIFDEGFSQGNMDTIQELIHEDFLLYSPTLTEPARGPEGAKAFVRGLRNGFPGFYVHKEDVVVADNKVIIRFKTEPVKHAGWYLGIPPTYRTVQMTGIGLYRVRDGQIDETWLEIDAVGGLIQMGVLPPYNINTPQRLAFAVGNIFRMAFLEAKSQITGPRKQKK